MQATKGELNLYSKIHGRTVRALRGKSSAGDGWRPVCGGIYLGNQCSDTEKEAIANGVKFVEKLKRLIDTVQKTESGCGACSDGCRDMPQCRVIADSPAMPSIKKRRNRNKETQK